MGQIGYPTFPHLTDAGEGNPHGILPVNFTKLRSSSLVMKVIKAHTSGHKVITMVIRKKAMDQMNDV